MGSVPCCRVGDTDGTTNWLNEMGLDVATMMRLGVFFEEIGAVVKDFLRDGNIKNNQKTVVV